MAFDMHEVMATSIPRLPFEKSFISGANPVTSKKEASTRSYEVPPNYFDCEPEQRALLDRALATFEYTDTSIYVGSARSFSNEEYMPCHCKLRRDAKGNKICCEEGSECINRLLQVECMRGVCPGSKYCKNQRFQRRQNAPVRLIHVENKGYGLQAAEDFSKGQFVMEYVGEVISHNAFVRRTEKYNLRGAKHFYFMSLNANKYIDATTVGSLARFINHSCNPNCVLQKWIVGSHVSIGIFTQRGIKKGEELTFDYKFQRYGAVAQKCYCGEPNCKGVLGSEKQTGIRGFDDPGDLFSSANFNRGLSSDGECSSLVQAMLQLAQEPEKALKVLKKLKLTEEPRLLKQFINLHGVVTLKTWLAEYSAEPEVCSAILSVLEHLPFMYKNKLLDAGVYETLREYVKSSPGVSDQVEALILRWEDLPKKYIIPRLPPSSSHTESNSPGNPAKHKHDVARQEPKPQASSGSLSQRVERPVSGPRHRNGRRSPTRNPRRGSLDLLPKDAASSSRLNTRRPNGSCPTRGSQPDYSGRHGGNRIDKPSHKVISQPSSDAGIQSNGSYSNCNADRGTARKVDYNSRVTCSRRDDSCDRKLSDAVAKGRPTSKCNDGRSISYGSLAPDNYYTLHDTAHDAFANGPAAEFEVLFPNHYVANVPRNPRFDASWAAPPFYVPPINENYPLPSYDPNFVTSNPHYHAGNFQASMAAPLEGPLPPNWNTAVASTGCIYYYNLLTNEVTWERPIFTPYQPIYTDMPLIPEYQQVSPAPNTQRVERAPSQDSHPKRPLQEAAPNPDLSSKRPRRKAQPLVGDTFYTYPELVARCRKMLSIEVVNSFSKFSKAISKDTFKKHAERMTSTLVEKEMRESCYKEGRMRRMTSDLRSKIRQFVEHYARRLLEKKLEYEKSLQA